MCLTAVVQKSIASAGPQRLQRLYAGYNSFAELRGHERAWDTAWAGAGAFAAVLIICRLLWPRGADESLADRRVLLRSAVFVAALVSSAACAVVWQMWAEVSSEDPWPLSSYHAAVIHGGWKNTRTAFVMTYGVAAGAIFGLRRLGKAQRANVHRGYSGFCHNCGYDLRASASRCPECGEPFTRNELRLVVRPLVTMRIWWCIAALVAYGVSAFGYFAYAAVIQVLITSRCWWRKLSR
jgi:hypothetical protein